MDIDILVITPNEQLRQLLQMELTLERYGVVAEPDSTIGCLNAYKQQPKLIILDSAAPGLFVADICTRLKTAHPELKILLLTDRDSASSFSGQVDDYIFNPLSLVELMLRLQLHLKTTTAPKCFRFQNLSLNLGSREVHCGERLVTLTLREFDLLAYLLQHPRQVIGHDQLLENVWGADFIGSHNVLQVCVSSLRMKLEANGEERLIHNVRGVGYVLKSVGKTSLSHRASTEKFFIGV